uniref:(northern house mosquito) hypothetical protein n=1 Tax=Culex pipiens TaxID=7175 RepID=A0A8D8HCU2_CULPI
MHAIGSSPGSLPRRNPRQFLAHRPHHPSTPCVDPRLETLHRRKSPSGPETPNRRQLDHPGHDGSPRPLNDALPTLRVQPIPRRRRTTPPDRRPLQTLPRSDGTSLQQPRTVPLRRSQTA